MSEFDPDLNPLLRRISSSGGAKDLREIYKLNDIDPTDGPDALASEIRLNGGNTLANFFRGWEGVSYREIVEDVAEKLEIAVSDTSSVQKMEEEILADIAEKRWKKLSEEEREKILDRIKEIDPKVNKDRIKNAFRVGGMGATIALRDIMAPLISQILVQTAARAGINLTARSVGFLIPGLNVLLGIWTVIDIAGPAYRKTVHTVVELAYRRLYHPD